MSCFRHLRWWRHLHPPSKQRSIRWQHCFAALGWQQCPESLILSQAKRDLPLLSKNEWRRAGKNFRIMLSCPGGRILDFYNVFFSCWEMRTKILKDATLSWLWQGETQIISEDSVLSRWNSVANYFLRWNILKHRQNKHSLKIFQNWSTPAMLSNRLTALSKVLCFLL